MADNPRETFDLPLILDRNLARAVRRPSGHILMDDKVVCDTVQCVHCSAHYVWITGSKRIRGFCSNCNGLTCGSPKCDACYIFEKKLDDYEKGKLLVLR